MKIKNFPEDAKITFLGEIFKFNHLKSWNIKLGIQDSNTLLVKHARLSNLPAFARGRYLNPSDGQCRKGAIKLISILSPPRIGLSVLIPKIRVIISVLILIGYTRIT
jgi:hypothetical protein